jgi:EmrB/QacA subfamily drug resistance transporter
MQTKRAKWGILLSCSMSCFVCWLDFAIVNTALPAIEKDLSASFVELQWLMNAITFAFTVLVVTFGRISDQIGRKMMNIIGVVCFGFFSLFAGIAKSPEWLIIGRALQGVASAMIIPSALALISHAFPGEQKGKAIGIWSGITSFGMAAGPAIGGFLVSALSWRWIFYINVPIAILSAILSAFYASESRLKSNGSKIDIKGLLLLTGGLGALIFSFMHAPDWGWESLKTLFLIASAIILLAGFYFSELHSPTPIIPFALLLNPTFFLPTLVMVGLVFVFTSDLFLLPLYLIQIHKLAAYQAGLIIFSITACMSIVSPFIGNLIGKIGAKKLILMGLVFFGMSTILQAYFRVDTSLYFIIASLVLLGIGWGIARPPATSTAIASAPHQYAGTATGVLWSVQNTGSVFSIAIVMTIFRMIFLAKSTPDAFIEGYKVSMHILSAVTLATILIIAIYMKPHSRRGR